MRGSQTRIRGDENGLTKRQKLSPGTVARSRRLRRDATDAEKALWRALRERLPAAKFRFQVPFGSYTADFCSHSAKLIVEVDGGQHGEADTQAHDEARTRFLAGEGYRVLRFWNNDVLANTGGVIEAIAQSLSPCGMTARNQGVDCPRQSTERAGGTFDPDGVRSWKGPRQRREGEGKSPHRPHTPSPSQAAAWASPSPTRGEGSMES